METYRHTFRVKGGVEGWGWEFVKGREGWALVGVWKEREEGHRRYTDIQTHTRGGGETRN